MVLITRGKDIIGRRCTLLKVEEGLIWVEGISRGLKPNQIEFGNEDMKAIEGSKELMEGWNIKPKFFGRWILRNKLSKI